jgi:hypothetical protein
VSSQGRARGCLAEPARWQPARLAVRPAVRSPAAAHPQTPLPPAQARRRDGPRQRATPRPGQLARGAAGRAAPHGGGGGRGGCQGAVADGGPRLNPPRALRAGCSNNRCSSLSLPKAARRDCGEGRPAPRGSGPSCAVRQNRCGALRERRKAARRAGAGPCQLEDAGDICWRRRVQRPLWGARPKEPKNGSRVSGRVEQPRLLAAAVFGAWGRPATRRRHKDERRPAAGPGVCAVQNMATIRQDGA